MNCPSLQPQVAHPISVRFDPSYHYERGQRPKELAKSLAQGWRAAGVTLVFYRAYDPHYGAFYRTSYPLNLMGDFGKYDLLKHVAEQCHRRGIKVYAWLPVLNHRGAWEKNPSWRAMTASGSYYSAQGLSYPLCARLKEVREWWYGFLGDILENYPHIDGIDFGEPVVSWAEGQACYCEGCREALKKKQHSEDAGEIRARALTELLGASISRVHKAGKKASVTTVQSADNTGRLLSSRELMKITGFDLEGVLHGGDDRAPDIICPEFLWQELRSRSAGESVFNPGWTEKALKQFMERLDTPVEVIAHLEITDFPGVEVDAAALKESLHAAIRGGASGVDVYSSSELDKKSAWEALSEMKGVSKRKKCLVLFDQQGGKNDALQVEGLLRHFNAEVRVQPMGEYSSGMMSPYDTVFYVGVLSGAEIPQSFLADLRQVPKTLCWLGFNIEIPLGDESISTALGMEFVTVEEDRFKTVRYEGSLLSKKDPWTTVVKPFDPQRCRVLATACNGETDVPYVIRSGRNFWYFADVPTSHAVEGDRLLVFADLLHEILNEPHVSRQLALIRIEDVHPLSDPKSLTKIADFLHKEGVPFQVSVVPFYVSPEQNIHVGLHGKPELVEAVKHMIKKGGCVLMHGTTHQRFGETTADYEFWDPVNDRPPEGENPAAIKDKIETGLREFWSVGIYPLLWETPHYAGSQQLYKVVGEFFSAAMERRQTMDKLGTDQYFPYLVSGDRHGQVILPENLGYVPMDRQDPEVILAPARNMKAVRDGVASFFFHPFVNFHVLREIIRSMKREGFQFATIGDLPLHVKSSFGAVTNRSGKISVPSGGINGKETRLDFPGIAKKREPIEPFPAGEFSREISLKRGELYAAHFISSEVMSSGEDRDPGQTEIKPGISEAVPNFYGERCAVPAPLLLDFSQQPFRSEDEADAMASLFGLAGISVSRQSASSFTQIPPGVNLVLIPEASARALNEQQIRAILQELKLGRISVVTSGFTSLADELGVQRINRQTTVAAVKDNFFSDVEIHWDPPQEVSYFESPGDASFIYEDRATGNPLVISGSLGKGGYMFLTIPYRGDDAYGSSFYPYLLTHVFRCFRLFPLVRKAGCEVYFNPAEREGISIEALIKDWRRNGVRTVYAAAWQVFPEWTYDYSRLIRLAHTNGMLVYAWFELPYVNEKFWLEHPQWREKNGLGEDAAVEWRKPMALGDPACFEAVKKEIKVLLGSHDWDGVILNRVGWESPEGVRDPESYTPFHFTLRSEFQARYGFDPKALFDLHSTSYWKDNPGALARFEEYRRFTAKKWVGEILTWLANLARAKDRDWEIIVTHEETESHCGLSLEELLSLKDSLGFSLQLATSMEKQWEPVSPSYDMVRLFLAPSNSGGPFLPDAPTSYPTGTALYFRLYDLVNSKTRFSLFSESALFEVDKQVFPFLLASGSKAKWSGDHLKVEMPTSAEIAFVETGGKNMVIDGALAGSFRSNRLVVPVGVHAVGPPGFGRNLWAGLKSDTRLVDCSGDLLKTEVRILGLDVTYWSNRRAALVVSEKPLAVYVDGVKTDRRSEKGLPGWGLMVPQGRHTVTVKTRTVSDVFLVILSLILSNTILLVSVIAIAALILIAAVTATRRKTRESGRR